MNEFRQPNAEKPQKIVLNETSILYIKYKVYN